MTKVTDQNGDSKEWAEKWTTSESAPPRRGRHRHSSRPARWNLGTFLLPLRPKNQA